MEWIVGDAADGDGESREGVADGRGMFVAGVGESVSSTVSWL
jgi:hypothetical protein